ncbi:fasciclin domain-containing protein [Lentiprolixibacter aurantiacus]|uniref:Fasciclin domain-containing protein n=1 Tax=Lentiprolixibacter aurantiacus TaxID=2993939 RepID=A0AAE3SNQ1_9FLAO|nr:fasciclin domain-containing protein [Lentiprolixibacter aurantiacus]MCX2719997.1 fasciclin domain-containing protein [Lentiprolixibacter aurantiacus]
MKKLIHWKSLFSLLFISLLFVGCEKQGMGNDEPETTPNIMETAQASEALSSLVTALTAADTQEDSDLIGTLSSEGPFTVFAPTNDAFADLLDQLEDYDSLEDFDDDEDLEILETILKYHVVSGVAVRAADLTDGQEIGTVLGESVTVSLDNGVFIQDATETPARVIIPDVEASNGIVHVINKVLLPQVIIDALNNDDDDDDDDDELGTLVELVVETESLSVLEEAVIKAGLVETLNSAGPFTVFAPTDDAFVALLEVLGDDYNSLDDFDTEAELMLLTDILLYHVIPAKVLAADLEAGNVGTALSDNNLEIIPSGESFVIGDTSDVNANITGTDFLASNGVAHTIDKVLLPQSAIDFVMALNLKTIVEIAVETDDLSLLVEALQQANAGLVETLSGDGPFTVFAPTNKAFEDVLELLGDDYHSLADFDTDEEKAILVDILTYHVVAGAAAFSTDLTDGQQIPTVQGESLSINLKDNTVHVVDVTGINASVVIPDVEASNGVVHVIDKVLLPQSALDAIAALSLKNIVEIAVATNDLKFLVASLKLVNAGLVEALSGEGPFTVFAPTNAAFVSLLFDLGKEYHSIADFDTEEKRDLLVKILTYHVVAGTAAFSTDLSDGQSIPTLQGEDIGISLKDGTVHIVDATHTNATVVTPDVEGSNGVIHIINKVLIPQEILDVFSNND